MTSQKLSSQGKGDARYALHEFYTSALVQFETNTSFLCCNFAREHHGKKKGMYVMRCMGFTRVQQCSSKQTRPLITFPTINQLGSNFLSHNHPLNVVNTSIFYVIGIGQNIIIFLPHKYRSFDVIQRYKNAFLSCFGKVINTATKYCILDVISCILNRLFFTHQPN